MNTSRGLERIALVLWVLIAAVAINTIATFLQARRAESMNELVSWMIPYLAAKAAINIEPLVAQSDSSRDRPFVDLYYSIRCPACIRSLDAIESVRHEFPEIRWRVHYLTDQAHSTSLDQTVALFALCATGNGSPWDLLKSIGGASEAGVLSLARNAAAETKRCMQQDSTVNLLWSMAFAAAARNVERTPTLDFAGVRVEGELRASPLRTLLSSRPAGDYVRVDSAVHVDPDAL